MSKKLDELIKSLKKAKEILNKDDVDEKIKAKMIGEMNRRGMTGKHIADHYRDIDETIPAKQRSNIKNSLKIQEAKTEAVKKLKVVKKDKPVDEPMKKSAISLADELLKSLESISGLSKDEMKTIQPRRDVNGQTGWSQDPASGAFHNKIHGVISTNKTPDGTYNVVHSGKQLGSFPDVAAAGAKVKEHMDWLGSFKGGAGISRYAKTVKSEDTVEKSEEQKSMDLLNQRVGAMMKGPSLQPSNEEFEAAMQARGMGVTAQQAEAMNKSHGQAINNWFAEAMKPISSRFKSPEEEEAYWANLKVGAKEDNGPGY